MPAASFFRLGARTLARAGFLHVERRHLLAPDGTSIVRLVVRHPGAIAVVPLLDGEVILIRQFRAALGRSLLEIPAGKLDVVGEPPEQTARRELEEETGYRAGKLERLGEVYTSPGFSDEHMTLYRASDLVATEARPTGAEEAAATVERFPLDEALAMIGSGQIVDAKTVIGLLRVAQGG